jgi:hypothetical protein
MRLSVIIQLTEMPRSPHGNTKNKKPPAPIQKKGFKCKNTIFLLGENPNFLIS